MNPYLRSPASTFVALLLAAGSAVAQRDALVRNRSSAHPGPDAHHAVHRALEAAPAKPAPAAFGRIERMVPEFDALVAPDATMEKLADGFDWSEGPVWDRRHRRLLFSDVPVNKVFSWSEKKGLSVFLEPSGYTGKAQKFREQGSNGLTTDKGGRLVLCQHGDRRVARLLPDGSFQPLAEYFGGRRFNSPNDLCFASNGNLYFTDPPYGLEGVNESPIKELLFNGVYLRRPSGEVVLLTSKLAFPNGVALSPDEKTLYVNQSNPKSPTIHAFPVDKDGTVGEGRVFFDASPLVAGRKGLPDGLKVDEKGNLWSSGPGGIMVISPAGTLLGILNTGEATANCAWGDDGSTLYITADAYLLRIRTLSRGAGWPKFL
jgi:gluconolactonase